MRFTDANNNLEQYIYNSYKIREKLEDETSRRIYDARVRLSMGGSIYDFFDEIGEEYDSCIIDELDGLPIIRQGKTDGIIIYGAGLEGRYVYHVIRKSKYSDRIKAFCDSSGRKWDTEYCGLPVINPERIKEEPYNGCLIVIAVAKNPEAVYRQLLSGVYNRDYLFLPQYGRLVGMIGKQYFDYLTPMEHEVFVDCGALDLGTSYDFRVWCNDNYDEIIAFEPDPISYRRCQNEMDKKEWKRTRILNAGVWNETTSLRFSGSGGGGSTIQQTGDIKVDVCSIDETLNGARCSYIKMDIEGAEYEALTGAKETIIRHKPRLAICLYHKTEDIFVLPGLVTELNPDYRLAIRHYATNNWETVLYAF